MRHHLPNMKTTVLMRKLLVDLEGATLQQQSLFVSSGQDVHMELLHSAFMFLCI